MRKSDKPVVVEQTFNRPIERVWSAITDLKQMQQWFFENIPSFKPEAGFETQFNVLSQGRNFLHMWKITEVIPKKKITYNWRYEGYPGDSFVLFELFREDQLTKLRLTHQVNESFPEDVPEFNRESCIGGWTYFIKKRLKEFLDGSN